MGRNHDSGLVKLPTLQVWKITLTSLVLGIWFLCKRTFTKLLSYRSVAKTTEKPPSCLQDSTLGVHSYVKLRGVKFHYLDAGQKNSQLIVLLHGFPDCWFSWRYQIPVLSQYYRVVAIDLKGFGDSDKPEGIQHYNVEVVAKEIHDLISLLGFHKCILIGHDLGALIGWFYIHLYEDAVTRFISVSAPHPNYYWEAVADSRLKNSSLVQFSLLPHLPEMMAMDDDLKFLDDAFGHLKSTPDCKTILNAYKYAFSRKEDWTGAINYLRTLSLWRVKTSQKYNVNALFIVGNRDSSELMQYVIKSTDFLDKSSVKLIENAGHFPHQEKPTDFNQLLINYLVGLPAAAQNQKKEANNAGLVNRMFGAVSSTVKYGTGVIDVIQKTSNGITSRAPQLTLYS